MAVKLSTYRGGYWGYMNEDVRQAIAEVQEAGRFLGTFESPAPFLSRASGGEAEKGDWGIDAASNQVYVYNENSGSFTVVGTTEAQVQAMIDASGSYGGVSTLLSSNPYMRAERLPNRTHCSLTLVGTLRTHPT